MEQQGFVELAVITAEMMRALRNKERKGMVQDSILNYMG